MPYESEAQRKKFNANKDEIGEDTVREFNRESKGRKLPKRKGKRGAKKRTGKRG